MKPVVGVMQAWGCVVISIFAIAILSVIGGLYKANHHAFMGGDKDPDPDQHAAVASTVFSAVIVYALFLAFCGFQVWLHVRENKRGTISLR